MHFQSVLKNMLNNLSLDSSYFQVRNQPEISFFLFADHLNEKQTDFD